MVYYSRQYGKCHVCQKEKPTRWFRCVICGVWMGSLCNPRQVPLAKGLDDDEDESRFEQFEVSLHCYIWTSEVKLRSQRADLCSSCCIDEILNKFFARELPILAQRRILQYVSWGSWWWCFELMIQWWSNVKLCGFVASSWGRGISPIEAIAT